MLTFHLKLGYKLQMNSADFGHIWLRGLCYELDTYYFELSHCLLLARLYCVST